MLPRFEQSGFPGQSGVWQPSPVHPLSHTQWCVALLHCPCPLQSLPIPGQPGFSQNVPRHPLTHLHSPFTTFPCSEHSLSQPTPTYPGSQTQFPLSMGNCFPWTQGLLHDGPIQPAVQLRQAGGFRVLLHTPRPKQSGEPGQSGISQLFPVQPLNNKSVRLFPAALILTLQLCLITINLQNNWIISFYKH